MLTFQINKIITLGLNDDKEYEGIAFDGCLFYITVPKDCEIVKYNPCTKNTEYIQVSRGYTSICYDICSNCFWAVTNKNCNKIFKLDLCLREIDSITIKSSDRMSIYITGISCNNASENLLISFNDGIALVDKCDNATLDILNESSSLDYTGVVSLCDYHLISYERNGCAGLSLFSSNNELMLKCCLPDGYFIDDMTSVYTKDCCNKVFPTIYILSFQCDGSVSLIECSIMRHLIDEYSIFDEFTCIPGLIHHCNKTIDGKESCSSLIESIALTQAAISHILNAEGEKIQKVVSISQRPCEILKVNDSVNKTLMNITHIEQILLSKLQLIFDMCPDLCSSDENICNPCEHCDSSNPCDPCDFDNFCDRDNSLNTNSTSTTVTAPIIEHTPDVF